MTSVPIASEVPTVDVVGVGLNAADHVVSLREFPASGAKVEFRDSSIMLGGMVATTIVACQRWGLATRYIGKLGTDHAADLHEQAFAQAGVEAHLLKVAACDSQQSVILVDGAGERTVLWKRDERLALAPHELTRSLITSARALHVDGYDTAAAVKAAEWAREAGVPVVADLDDLYDDVESLLPLIDYLIVSRDFPRRLTGEPDLDTSLFVMRERYGARLTAATLGPEGVLALDETGFHYHPAYRVSVVDTTGAGDIFHAGFLYGLLRPLSLPDTLNFACAAAALSCTALGARGGIGPVEQIHELMRSGERYADARPRAAGSHAFRNAR